MLVDLNNLGVLEVFILSICLKCHLCIFVQNMRVSPPSMELCASISSTVSLTHSQKTLKKFKNIYTRFPNAHLEVRCIKISFLKHLIFECSFKLCFYEKTSFTYITFKIAYLDHHRLFTDYVLRFIDPTANFVRVFGSYSRLVFKDQIYCQFSSSYQLISSEDQV